jgi:hypothetical protein
MLKYDCGCSMLVVDKEKREDREVNYNISVQDSRYDHNYATLWTSPMYLTAMLLKNQEGERWGY